MNISRRTGLVGFGFCVAIACFLGCDDSSDPHTLDRTLGRCTSNFLSRYDKVGFLSLAELFDHVEKILEGDDFEMDRSFLEFLVKVRDQIDRREMAVVLTLGLPSDVPQGLREIQFRSPPWLDSRSSGNAEDREKRFDESTMVRDTIMELFELTNVDHDSFPEMKQRKTGVYYQFKGARIGAIQSSSKSSAATR